MMSSAHSDCIKSLMGMHIENLNKFRGHLYDTDQELSKIVVSRYNLNVVIVSVIRIIARLFCNIPKPLDKRERSVSKD